MEGVNSLRISAPLWWPLREGRDGKCEGRNEFEKCEFLARESVSSSRIVRIFGKEKCKFIANFSATMVTSLPSLSVCLYLSLSPKVPHAQYRKRFRASYDIERLKCKSAGRTTVVCVVRLAIVSRQVASSWRENKPRSRQIESSCHRSRQAPGLVCMRNGDHHGAITEADLALPTARALPPPFLLW